MKMMCVSSSSSDFADYANPRLNSRRIFRETKFDRSTHSFLKTLAGIAACMLLPIAAAVIAVTVILNKYDLAPGSAAASASGMIIVAAAVVSCLGTYYFARNNAVGNKYKYFIIDEDGRLMYTNSGKEEIFAYYSKNVPISEKLKSTPNALFGMTFFHGMKPFIGAFSYLRMEQFFKYNQKHRLAEKLLSGADYRLYCRQIISVERIKFFKSGCNAAFTLIINGEKKHENCNLYTSMNGYSELVGCMLKLYGKELSSVQLKKFEVQSAHPFISSFPKNDTKKTATLSESELRQVRKLLVRKNILFLIFAAILIILTVLSLMQSQSTAYKSDAVDLLVFSKMYSWLSARAYRRACLCIFYILMAAVSMFKCIVEWFSAKKCTKEEPESVRYEIPKKMLGGLLEYSRYKASVDYIHSGQSFTVVLGVSSKLWNNRNNERAVLVMKNNAPCCLILSEQENENIF